MAADDRNAPIGITWLRKDQYGRLRAASADSRTVHATYEEWEDEAKRTLRQLRGLGREVLPVPVELDELIAWCRAGQRALDAGARAEFTSLKLKDWFAAAESTKATLAPVDELALLLRPAGGGLYLVSSGKA